MSVTTAGEGPFGPTAESTSGQVTVTARADRLDASEGAEEPIGLEQWLRLATAVLVDEGAVGRLDLTFVDQSAMAELNRHHMGQAGPTDVLAFPLDGAPDGPESESEGGEVPRLLGDVVICPAIAARNASARGTDSGHDGRLESELALLVVHGALHILGWDHATERERVAMRDRERHHLDRWESAGDELGEGAT